MLSKNQFLPAESLTIVMSESGWVRAAKGHDVDPKALNFRTGDHYMDSVKTRSNQPVIFLDSSGRSYATSAHTLPSARGQGEPLSGRFQCPSGARFVSILAGNSTQSVILSNTAGYGFITRLDNLVTKNKAGKTLFNLPDGAEILPPLIIDNIANVDIAAVSKDGRLLIFSADDMPVLNKGKGVRLIHVAPARFKAKQESLHLVTLLPKHASLVLYVGKRRVTLKPLDIENYIGERGRRGRKLPRGLQKVSRIELAEFN